jgi:4-hydroxy-2-oxoglutarate aldolase
VGELGVPGIKAAMDEVGLVGGAPRAPIPEIAEKERARVRALLTEAGLVRG